MSLTPRLIALHKVMRSQKEKKNKKKPCLVFIFIRLSTLTIQQETELAETGSAGVWAGDADSHSDPSLAPAL